MKPIRLRAAWRLLIACLLALNAAPAATAAKAAAQIPLQYPELTPEALLPTILTELRRTLTDIYSVREMRLCPAEHIKLKDGQPSGWSVRFEYNAKNENGGYTGLQRDVAIFRNKRIAYPIGSAKQFGREGLDGLISKAVDKQMAACPRIPDAAVQQALQAVQ